MSNKDSAATCQHANLMPVTSQGSVYVSRCTSCNEVRVDSDWQKDSAAEQRCPECQWLISAVGHSPSCSHAFSEAAASEGVPPMPDKVWIDKRAFYHTKPPFDSKESDGAYYARVRASVDEKLVFELSWKDTQSFEHVQAALIELEKINTAHVAANGLSAEATAISAARVFLDGYFQIQESKIALRQQQRPITEVVKHLCRGCNNPDYHKIDCPFNDAGDGAFPTAVLDSQRASPCVSPSVDGAGLGPFDDSQPVLAALSRLMDDGDATDSQRRTARMALKELAKRSPVDEATVRRLVMRLCAIKADEECGIEWRNQAVEIITTELQKGK